ncbi:hypothetical protein [Promicromonospora sp. NPDC059942]|uniref:hypothetical protein n=1 Tax=Promicromonospora sp. NPDC059942 TaxID=3347009 RepID=UPI003652EA34
MTTLRSLLGLDDQAEQRRLTSDLAETVRSGGGFVPWTAEATGALSDLLDQPVGNLAFRAWRAHQEVLDAKERTSAVPGQRETVRLLEHTIRSVQEPVVEVTVDGKREPLLNLELEVLLRIVGANIVVESGHVLGVRHGPVSGSATLSVGGVPVAHRDLPIIDVDEGTTTVVPGRALGPV